MHTYSAYIWACVFEIYIVRSRSPSAGPAATQTDRAKCRWSLRTCFPADIDCRYLASCLCVSVSLRLRVSVVSLCLSFSLSRALCGLHMYTPRGRYLDNATFCARYNLTAPTSAGAAFKFGGAAPADSKMRKVTGVRALGNAVVVDMKASAQYGVPFHSNRTYPPTNLDRHWYVLPSLLVRWKLLAAKIFNGNDIWRMFWNA